ncbi:hypothetical protein [Kitasatospora camelliae]|uniref:Uncharacterized protein n=1 Tax=Kitasatospora camelliae TaxID=3156397 RepID=A0AAU8JZ53_9ACTN
MTADQGPHTAASQPEIGFDFDVPVDFHDLGMHLTDEERWAHLEEVASEIWSGGTDYQRQGVQQLYADVAAAAAGDGASYAGICMFATEDDRVSTASLIIRSDTIDSGDLETITGTLQESLSLNPSVDVYRTEVEVGPALVQFMAIEWTPPAPSADAPRPAAIPLVNVDVYIPLPKTRSLLVMSLTTPSLPDLPHYVALMSELAETVRVHDDQPTVPEQRGESAARIEAAFG